MTDPFPIEENLAPFITLSWDTAIAAAAQSLHQSDASFAVVGQPVQLLISAEQMNDLSAMGDTTLRDFFDPPPPIIEISAGWQTLAKGQIRDLLEYAVEDEAVGIVVYADNETVGILDADTLAEQLPTESTRVSKGVSRSMSDSTVGVRVYVCSRCDRIWSPTTGDAISSATPSCRNILCGGQMTLMEP